MSERPPATVIAAAVLEALEGLVAAGFGIFVGYETVAGDPVDPLSAIGVTVLALFGGAGMIAVGRGLVRLERWSRAPAVVTQLFALPVSWSLIQSDQRLIGIPLIVTAVAALVLVLSGPSTRALELSEADGPGAGDS